MKIESVLRPALLLAIMLPVASWADIENGQELHDNDCLGCHGTEVYSRDDRKVKDHFGLKRQVSMCITMTGKGADWFPEDQADVVEYLDKAFYHTQK